MDASLDSRQIYFVNQIVEYVVHNGLVKDLSVLQEAPFTDQGSIGDIFTDISIWLGIRAVIDKINANAVAAAYIHSYAQKRNGCPKFSEGCLRLLRHPLSN